MKSAKGSKIQYELSEDEVLELYYSDPRLAALMELNVIKLIDSHLVVNLKEFITPKTHKLSANAKRNLSACCVGVQYADGEIMANKDGRVCSTLDILIQAAGFVERGTSSRTRQTDQELNSESSKIGAEIDRINDILNEVPGSFSGTLKYHMERKGYTEELLAQESWLSLSTIKQYRQKESKEKTLKSVTAICIGMHLHPWLTEDLLRKAGITPKATSQDSAYKYLYTFQYKESLDECNIYLRARGLQEFTQREKSA